MISIDKIPDGVAAAATLLSAQIAPLIQSRINIGLEKYPRAVQILHENLSSKINTRLYNIMLNSRSI